MVSRLLNLQTVIKTKQTKLRLVKKIIKVKNSGLGIWWAAHSFYQCTVNISCKHIYIKFRLRRPQKIDKNLPDNLNLLSKHHIITTVRFPWFFVPFLYNLNLKFIYSDQKIFYPIVACQWSFTLPGAAL